MADTKISNLTAGTPAQSTDRIPVARAGANVYVPVSDFATAAQGTKADGAAQIAGDLGGTAATPVVAKINGVAVTGTPTSGQVPTATSGTAATWQTPASGGTPGGSDTQPQFNNAGAFAGMAGITWVPGTSTYTFGGGVVVNFAGATSGLTRLKAPAVAVTGDVILPNAAGTLAVLGANTFTDIEVIAAGTRTALDSLLSITGTWNNAGTFPGALKLNITDTSSAAASLVLDMQVGGVSKFSVKKDGSITTAASSSSLSGFGGYLSSGINCNNQSFTNLPSIGLSLSGFLSYITAVAATGTVRLGQANAAAPVAHALEGQGSRAGTDSNVGGASLTILPGTGTGNATPGALIFKSMVAVASGTGAQTATTTLTLNSGVATFAGNVTVSANGLTTTPGPVSTLPTASAYSGTRCYVNDATMTILTGNGTTVAGSGANVVPVGSNGTNWLIGG